MDHTQLMDRLVNWEYPPLEGEDEELVRRIYRLVVNDVVIFALAMQNVPPEAHLDQTPYIAGVLFRNKFGRVTLGQMVIVGPAKYSSIGMRLGRLILQALVRRGIEMHDIEFMLYLFLKVANESIQVLTQAGELVTTNGEVSEEHH